MVSDSEVTGTRYHGGDGDGYGGVGRKLECCHCGGEQLKRNCPKRAEKKEKTKKDYGGKWQSQGDKDKRADGKTEVKGGQLHTMFTSFLEYTSGTDFSELGEDNEFTWNQFHVKGLGARDFEGHAPVAMHNTTGHTVPLTWLLLSSQSTVCLITKAKMSVNISKVQGEDAIRVH